MLATSVPARLAMELARSICPSETVRLFSVVVSSDPSISRPLSCAAVSFFLQALATYLAM